jgi:hypothetical protein
MPTFLLLQSLVYQCMRYCFGETALSLYLLPYLTVLASLGLYRITLLEDGS